MTKREEKILSAFPEYKEGGPYVGTRQYWENVFSRETNRDPKLHEAFSALHEKIVNEVIAFCKEHNLEVDEFCVSADGIRDSRDFGEWTPGTDSTMSMYAVKKNPKGRCRIVDRSRPFLYEI